MRMSWCNCSPPKDYQRLRRSWWMHLLPNRKLLHCRKCGERLLVPLDA